MLNMSYDHGCHFANQFCLDPEDLEVLLIIAGLASYTKFGITIKINPTAWREFLSGRGAGKREALS